MERVRKGKMADGMFVCVCVGTEREKEREVLDL